MVGLRRLPRCPLGGSSLAYRATQRSGRLLDHGRLVGRRLFAGALAVVLAHALRVGAAAAAGQEATEQRRRHVVYLRKRTGSVCSRTGRTA